MTVQSPAKAKATTAASKRKKLITAGAIVVVVILMALGTKIETGSEATADTGKFSAAEYAKTKWDKEILPAILDNANDLVEVSTAIQADPAAASKKFGVVEGSSAPVYTVTFTGVADAAAGGLMPVTVPGMPEGVGIRVQMGPAINGTAIRDASGTVHFPQFTNQIEYQDVGSELNNIIKTTVLADVKADTLAGKTVTMTGSFQWINPTSYLITPVKIEVAP